MKKLSKEAICGTSIISSLIIALISCHNLLKGGYARDAGFYLPEIIDKLVWLSLPLSLILFILFMILFKKNLGAAAKNISLGVVIIFLIFGIAVNAIWAVSLSQLKNTTDEQENLQFTNSMQAETFTDII